MSGLIRIFEVDTYRVRTRHGDRWQAEGVNYHPAAIICRRSKNRYRAAAGLERDLRVYARTGRRTLAQLFVRATYNWWRFLEERAERRSGDSQ